MASVFSAKACAILQVLCWSGQHPTSLPLLSDSRSVLAVFCFPQTFLSHTPAHLTEIIPFVRFRDNDELLRRDALLLLSTAFCLCFLFISSFRVETCCFVKIFRHTSLLNLHQTTSVFSSLLFGHLTPALQRTLLLFEMLITPICDPLSSVCGLMTQNTFSSTARSLCDLSCKPRKGAFLNFMIFFRAFLVTKKKSINNNKLGYGKSGSLFRTNQSVEFEKW